MTLFLSIACLLMVLILGKYERKRLLITITPIFSLGVPYSVIMVAVAIYDQIQPNNYDKMHFLIPIVSMFFLAYFYLIGKLVISGKFSFIKWNTNAFNERKTNGITYQNGLIKYFIIMGLLFVILNEIMHFGLSISNTDEFKDFFSQGVVSHVVNLVSILFLVHYAGDNTTKLDEYIDCIAVIWALFLILANAKYSALMYAASLLIIKVNCSKKQVSKIKIGIGLLIVSGLFILTYTLRFFVQGFTFETMPFDFIFQHFFFYLTNGYYTFSKVLIDGLSSTPGVGWGVFWAPIMNVFNIIVGSSPVGSMSDFVDYYEGRVFSSNTFTLYGSLILEAGWIGAIFSITVLSIISYTILRLYLGNKGMKYNALYAFVNATLIFSFFNCFYGTVNVWEKTIVLFFISYLLRYKVKIKHRIKGIS